MKNIYYQVASNFFEEDEEDEMAPMVAVSYDPHILSDNWKVYGKILETFQNSSLGKKYDIKEATDSIFEFVYKNTYDTPSFKELKDDIINCELPLIKTEF